METVSIVIPTYNESQKITGTVNSITAYSEMTGQPFEVIISDDGSTDETRQKVATWLNHNSNIFLLRNAHAGKAATVAAGVQKATGELLLMMDADGATEIDQLEKLMRAVKKEGADIAIGSREGHGAQRLKEPFYRHLLGRVFNRLVKALTGLKFEDTQCGFKLFKTPVLKGLSQRSSIMNRRRPNLKEPLVTAFDVELLVLAQRAGYKIVEVPIVWRHVPSQNVSPFRDSLRMFRDVLLIKFNLLRGVYTEVRI